MCSYLLVSSTHLGNGTTFLCILYTLLYALLPPHSRFLLIVVFTLVCTYVCMCYYPHLLLSALAVPHAVPAPDSAGLLLAVVALSVVLFAVLLLLAAAVFTAILFYTRESLH